MPLGLGSFEVGVHLAFAPGLFSPDPVRAIPLLGPTGDFVFWELFLWFLLSELYSLRLKSIPILDWGGSLGTRLKSALASWVLELPKH